MDNHVILLQMDEKCYAQTESLKAIQKWLVRLMEFPFTHKVDTEESESPIYSFLAIKRIHSSDPNHMRNFMALSANYSPFIYTSVLFTIGILVRQYSSQKMTDEDSEILLLTEIIKKFTNTYCKNDSLSVL